MSKTCPSEIALKNDMCLSAPTNPAEFHADGVTRYTQRSASHDWTYLPISHNGTCDFSVQSVRNIDQLEQACRLLYCKYRTRGYCEENNSRLYFSPHMLGQHSRTFVLEAFQRVLGTVSIFPDDALGVPIESLYTCEISRLRQHGIRFAEIGLLATDITVGDTDPLYFSPKNRVLPVFLLFKIGINYALSCAISHLVIAVHPKHRRLYEFLGFTQFADTRRYHAVCDHPAVPMIQNLNEQSRLAAPALRNFFLSSPFSNKHFSRSFADAADPFAELFGSACNANVWDPGTI